MAGFMATMAAKLNLDISNFSSKLSEAAGKMSTFASNADKSYGRATAALKSHNLGLKDTARIVQGIMVSQAFYGAANAIGNATSALWDFNVALDYMKVTYSALFGDTKVANDFMSVLQEHSIETIFDYQSLADASKKLLAYGIEYENLMFVMEGLTNLGAMSGDSAALDRIALALGQIYTKGKLSAEEMRQLANAYIPITEILQDKFGLTGDDLKRVGDLNLPASDVINAIVDYANENFGSVGDAAMLTITGLQSRIVDTLKVVGSQMLQPITTAYKSFLAYISKSMDVLRAEFEAGGIGGVFEYLVPDEASQQVIRQFLANVRNMFMSLMSVGAVVGQVFGNFASVFVVAFNIVAPIITGLTNVLASLLNAMLQNRTGAMLLRIALVAAAGAFVVLKVQAAAALVITVVTKAVVGLAKALALLAALISKHPILSLLAALAITLVGVSAASNNANKSISSLFDTFSGANGASSGDMLQKVAQDLGTGSDALDQFNNRLDGSTDSAEALEKALNGAGGAAGKAAKKTGGLLSFDEVFKLPEPSKDSGGSGGSGGSGVGSGVLDDIGDLMEGLGGLGDALIPDIPDFSEYVKDFTDGLFGDLERGIFDKLASTGIGALIGGGIGAIIGGLLGGPAGALLGAKIGAFAGGFVGLMWDLLEGAISNTVIGAASGIATAISKAFGLSFSSLGQLIAKGTSIKNIFSGIAYALKTTGLKSTLKGGIIGAAIGLVVDTLAHMLWGTLAEKFEGANVETAKVGQTIGSVIGAIIGGLLGGPAGAIIGSAIGTFAGGFVGLFWDPIMEYFDPKNNRLTAFFVQTGIDIASWAKSTVDGLSTWVKDTVALFDGWWENTVAGLAEWFGETLGKFTTWWQDTVAIFTDWDNMTWDTLSTWFADTLRGFHAWADEALGGILLWCVDTLAGIVAWTIDALAKFNGWCADTLGGLAQWAADALFGFVQWGADTLGAISSWASNALSAVTTWCINALGGFGQWIVDVYNKFIEWKNNTGKTIADFADAAAKKLTDGLSTMQTNVGKYLGEIATKWSEKWGEIKEAFKKWWTELPMNKWLEDYVWTPLSKFFNVDSFWERISELLASIKKKFTKWWEGIASLFTTDVEVNASGGNAGASFTRPTGAGGQSMLGHAAGGVFNREHVARFAERNKAEAIIPLEENRAMQPFVDAVSNGLVNSLAPIIAQNNTNNANTLPPMYVGTLIADDRGLKQLYRKFELIQIQENDRRGTAAT